MGVECSRDCRAKMPHQGGDVSAGANEEPKLAVPPACLYATTGPILHNFAILSLADKLSIKAINIYFAACRSQQACS
jgi:hypothetical protein